MTVGSIGEAVAAASSLFRFGFRPGLPASLSRIAALGDRNTGDDSPEDPADDERDALFHAVETALRDAGLIDP